MKKEEWLGMLKNIGLGALGGGLGAITASKPVQQATEKKTGDLLGKYKPWIIGGVVLVGLSILASALTVFKKR